MESHLGDVVRMGEIAAMMFDKDEGLFVFATTHLDEMLQEFRRPYYTPWTSRYEAPAPIGQEAQPPAHGLARKAAKAVTANRGRGLRSAPRRSGGVDGQNPK